MVTEVIIKNNSINSTLKNKSLKNIEEALKKVESFFNQKINFKIVLFKTREEMDKIYYEKLGIKTEDWVIGGVFDENIIYFFEEEVYTLVSCHTKETYLQNLIHEITHIFIKILFNFSYPLWLNEGIAYVVANQDLDNNLKQPEENILQSYNEVEWMKTNPYLTAGKFTRFLLNKYGKERIFNFLKISNSNTSNYKFKHKFKDYFGKDIELDWEEWINDLRDEASNCY